jgi:hypothetical protein
MATSVATLIFNAETNQLATAEKRLDSVSKSADRAGASTRKMGQNMRLMRGPTSALSTTSGQLAVQFQDVAVQAQMGTDAVRIFGQQAPQILSVFGPTGAVIGALAAIGAAIATSVITAFKSAGDASKEFSEVVKMVAKSVNELTDGTLGLSEELLKLAERSQAAAQLTLAIALDNVGVASRKASKSIKELGIEGKGMYREIENISDGAERLLLNFDTIVRTKVGRQMAFLEIKWGAQAAGISVDSARHLFEDYLAAIDPNANGKNLVAFAENLAGIATSMDDPAFREFAQNLLNQAIEAEKTEEKAALLKKALNDLGGSTRLADQKTVDFIERLKTMASEAGKTREQILAMQVAQISDPARRAEAEQALKLIQFEADAREEATRAQKLADDARTEAEKNAREQAREAAAERRRQASDDAELRQIEREQKKQAEKEANEAAKKEVERINQEMSLRRQLLQMAKDLTEQERREQERRDSEAQTIRGNLEREGLLKSQEDLMGFYAFRENMLKDSLAKQAISEKEYQDGIKKLNEMGRDQKIASAGDALNALGRYNKDAFEMAKAYNSAKAIMDTYTAANNALANNPPPFNFIAAGAAIAMGLANLAQIQSQTFQGRALGGQVRAGQSYVVGERGPEVLTMGASGRITPNDKLNSGARMSATNVTNVSFTIQANDTAGFDDLLLSRRGQIVGIINEALNDQGRRAIA